MDEPDLNAGTDKYSASTQTMIAIVVIGLLLFGCVLVLIPFTSAILWAIILSFSSWSIFSGIKRVLGGRSSLAAFTMTLLLASIVVAPFVAEVIPAATLELARTRTAEHSPAIIFADLSDANFPAENTARDLRAAAPDARLVGFASHVDLKSLAAARAAGFDLTLSRRNSPRACPNCSNPDLRNLMIGRDRSFVLSVL